LFECLDQCIAPSLSCGDGSCYLPSCSCNLIPNCKNMRDEDNCKSHEICKVHDVCRDDDFYCDTEKIFCISLSAVCDHEVNCPNKLDETKEACEWKKNNKIMNLGCNESDFLCGDGIFCVPYSKVCDNIVHCPFDDADEVNCNRLMTTVSTTTTKYIANDKTCGFGFRCPNSLTIRTYYSSSCSCTDFCVCDILSTNSVVLHRGTCPYPTQWSQKDQKCIVKDADLTCQQKLRKTQSYQFYYQCPLNLQELPIEALGYDHRIQLHEYLHYLAENHYPYPVYTYMALELTNTSLYRPDVRDCHLRNYHILNPYCM
ncbi:unnamed protein product, partial [Didymodactylos carnosus]